MLTFVIVLLFIYSIINIVTALSMAGTTRTFHISGMNALFVVLAHAGYIVLVLSLL